MKVTVNFGSVRVIVPCGKGDLPVKKLMDLAITRYKKATGKSVDSWVTIHNLKLLSDGGILDPDDKLNDVADDREQITAVFDEELSSYLMHNGGDGTSASSVGTESPDIFQNGDIISIPLSKSSCDGSDVEIKEDKLTAGFLPLHVRRGSEPALNRLSPSLLPTIDSCKRWSAAVLASDECYKHLNSEGEEQSEDDIPPGEREDGSGEEKSVSYQQYLDSWNQEICLSVDQRKEPLGGPITSPKHSTDEEEDSDCSISSDLRVQVMKLKSEEGPLGIEIVPADKSPEKYNCVIIQGIVPGGRIDRDGRFCVGDGITEINGLKLNKDSYRNANEILKDAMKAPELSIHCIKKDFLRRKSCESKLPPAVLPKPLPKTEIKCDKSSDDSEKAKIAVISSMSFSTPTKKLLTSVLQKGTPVHSSIRKIGRRILVHLVKGSEGLGFSITSKDPNNGPPFFVKNILPAGAAVDDGRLKTGDKLLEVNKVDVSNLTQPEVLSILRKVPFGDMVELVISRQETDLSPSPSLPRELPPEKGGVEEVGIVPWKRRDIFTYEVPLNDTGSAGLGVSVKGKTSNTAKGPVDMGIFLKNIFHGGAAHKDGRLRTNDQLLNVNGISLLRMTNGQAMETLRRAMIQSEGPTVVSNAIILTVARRVPSHLCDNQSEHGEGSGHDRSDSLLSESGDSFYVSNENLSVTNKCNGVTPDTSTSDNSANTVIFMTPTHKGNTIDEEQETDQPVTYSSLDVPVSELIDIHCDEISDLDVNTQPHSVKTKGEVHQQQFVSDLIDLEENNVPVLNYKHVDQFRVNGSLGNHNKTFSNLTEMDLYNSSASEPDKEPEIRYCDSPASVRETTKRKRFPFDRNDNFKRNGLSRQSMPEKKLSWTYQRNHLLANENIIESETTVCSPPNSHQQFQCQNYSEHLGIREMPVDVGPVETSLRLQQRKFHRIKGSCNSPDCPYHAVPTTTGRESGSSDEVANQVGPSLGLYKSSSLESLQTMLHEKQKQNMQLPVANGNSSRGCNESFRAAVDKSFEATDSKESSVPDKIDKQQSVKHHTRAKTVGAVEKKDAKPNKKKGLFRGLGSVFRFGKSNKKASKEVPSTDCKSVHPELVNLQVQNTAQSEQERLQQQCQELLEQQRQLQIQQIYNHPANRHLSRNSFTFPRNRTISPIPSQNSSTMSPQSRQDRMYALRNEHQKKHKQRNGYYPQEDQEELYERKLKEIVDTAMINRPLPPLPHQQISESTSRRSNLELSPKSKDFEIYKEMSKPGSRKGFADPTRYSHYMNFQEIQQHLQQFRHHQNLFLNDGPPETLPQYSIFLNDPKCMVSPSKRQYRHTVSSPRSRPTSELFDLRKTDFLTSSFRGISESGSLPRKMFQNGRQRPPIPFAFRVQPVNDGNPTMNGHLPSNYYNQTSRNSGSKV